MHMNKPNNEVHEIVFAERKNIKLNAMEMNLLETPKTVKLVADNNLRAWKPAKEMPNPTTQANNNTERLVIVMGFALMCLYSPNMNPNNNTGTKPKALL